MDIIAVCGGIGSGKTVVCRVLECLGYKVYDCDSRARQIMESDMDIIAAIADRITPAAIDEDGRLNREEIAAVVFNDAEKLAALNAIVHGAVRRDILHWVEAHRCERRVFIETAILYQSGIDRLVDEVWEVTAPDDVRVRRVCSRNGLNADAVRARMRSQLIEPESRHPNEKRIINDGEQSVLLQVNTLLGMPPMRADGPTPANPRT